jgi:hypothetical protein
MIAHAQFTEGELEWMDKLSQKFPQSANAFQKMYALEKLGGRLSDAEKQSLFLSFKSRMTANRSQAQALLQYIEQDNLKGNENHPIKVLASRVRSSSDLE